ncbi:MAG: D-cysteine desulfhydrase family protein [Fimbriimonadaceae bacterium]|nr:D-cysteine desulfhydrase family protein [Fimbriimonadaceae bacterium]
MPVPSRVPLILAPTPLHPLPALGARIGLDLWIKRDDLTGFAGGGNKGRKLEYLMADVLASGTEIVLTCGSLQSNFVRQLGAACAMHGVRCVAVLMNLPYAPETGRPSGPTLPPTGGNVVLSAILGVETIRVPDGTWDALFEATDYTAGALERAGRRVYRIPVGGSSPVGAYGFVAAAQELAEQGAAFDAIVVPTSSGSTHTGLAWALKGSSTRLIGIACDAEPSLVEEEMMTIGRGLDELTGEPKGLTPADIEFRLEWVGAGYGVATEAGQRALETLARTEGVFLDPIYSAKAFAGLLAMAASGELTGRVLFWHTGGFPTLAAGLAS